ncbi:tetratricopeptide repeat protein [uncultured Gimesia sp.]|uniref:tetratricopeptide repeat protein n=1 Tax=uncultured Gimesia sp. TaxID=1678688 RepID=UPI0030D6EE89|tara:strand:- start:27995 stop:29092 length:1098 start_codon:yes stop_codon:yes gene_type:complete
MPTELKTNPLLLILACHVGFCPDLALSAEAPQIQPRIRIVTAKDAEIKTSGGTLQKVSPGEVVLVTQKNKEWLWIPLLAGWIKQTDVRSPEELVKFLNQALETKPTAERHHLRGIAFQVLKNYEQALSDFNAAIKLKTDNPHIYVNRGNIWRLKGDYAKALTDLNQAIQLDLSSSNAFHIRGLTYFENEQPQKAIADFNEAIRLNPQMVSALNARGIAYRSLNQLDQALQDFNQAIKTNKFVSEVFNNRATLWEQKQQYESAVNDYQRALELNPSSATAHNDLAWLYATCPDTKFRDPKAAVSHAEQACELTQSADWNMLDTLATAYRENQQADLAVKSLTKAIQKAPAEQIIELQKKLEIFQKL